MSHVIPSLDYKVSSFTQGSRGEITVGTHKELNRLVRGVKSIAGKPGSRLILRKLDPESLMVVTFVDASVAKEPGCKSQAGFITVVTTKDMATEIRDCCIIEFQSNTISCDAKRTMAAESAS